MNTDNGTDWDKVGNAIIIYHTNEEHPLWLSKEDLEDMLKVLEGEDVVNVDHSSDASWVEDIMMRQSIDKDRGWI